MALGSRRERHENDRGRPLGEGRGPGHHPRRGDRTATARLASRGDGRGGDRGRSALRRRPRLGSRPSPRTRASATPTALIAALALAPAALPRRWPVAPWRDRRRRGGGPAERGRPAPHAALVSALPRGEPQRRRVDRAPRPGRAHALPGGPRRQLAQRAAVPPGTRATSAALDRGPVAGDDRPRGGAARWAARRRAGRSWARRAASSPPASRCWRSASCAARTSPAPTTTPPAPRRWSQLATEVAARAARVDPARRADHRLARRRACSAPARSSTATRRPAGCSSTSTAWAHRRRCATCPPRAMLLQVARRSAAARARRARCARERPELGLEPLDAPIGLTYDSTAVLARGGRAMTLVAGDGGRIPNYHQPERHRREPRPRRRSGGRSPSAAS